MTSDDLIGSLVSELRPVRRLRSASLRALLWAGVAFACMTLCAWAIGERADLSQVLARPSFLADAGALLLLFALSARSAFVLSVPGQERGARALPLAALLLCLVLVAARWSPDAAWQPSCVVKVGVLTLAPALAAFVMLARAAPLRSGWTGFFAILSAAALAMLATRLICANDSAPHVLASHLGPLFVAALAGLPLGRLTLTRIRRGTGSAPAARAGSPGSARGTSDGGSRPGAPGSPR